MKIGPEFTWRRDGEQANTSSINISLHLSAIHCCSCCTTLVLLCFALAFSDRVSYQWRSQYEANGALLFREFQWSLFQIVQIRFLGDGRVGRRPVIPRGRHSEGSAVFIHFQLWQLTVRDTVRIRVRVSRLVVGISRTIPCNDHEWRLSEWRTLRNGGPFGMADPNRRYAQGCIYHIISDGGQWSEASHL